MAQRWATRKRPSKVKWEDVDKPKFFYELICALIVLFAIVYSVYTGTAPDNSGF